MELVTDVSNPDKLMYPDDGLTKRDVVGYYERVADRMLVHVARRPLTLHRFPNGIATKGFMQKNASEHFPATIERFEVPRREGGSTTYAVVMEAESIPYLANQGTIAFHVWTSVTAHPDRPDRLVFDLDPPEGDHGAAREAALAVRHALRLLEIESMPVTTGSSGYHVFSAIEPAIHIDEVADFSRRLAELVARDNPELLTTEFRIENRSGRVFVDWLRNRAGQTGIAPWSLRAEPGAPAAVPIRWEEIDDTPPRRWTLETIGERLDERDPLAVMTERPQSLAGAIERVAATTASLGIELAAFDRFRS